MSRPKRVCFVIGTRPEAIKTWPVIDHLLSREDFEVQVLLTGQHREMLHQVVELLGIPVTLDLDVMTANQTLESLTSVLSERVAAGLAELSPDCVIVQGDTTTVLVGALASFYANIPVGHLEAGLRSGHIRHPFPEEMNRRLVSVLADFHFAPTETARRALLAENVPDDRVWVTGNSGIDALRLMSERLDQHPADPDLAEAIDGCGKRIIAVTVHRRENHPFMADVARALVRILELHEDVEIIFPVHMSPAVRGSFSPILGQCDRCRLLDPLNYADFVRLMKASYLVLTDSGGVQEEAPWLGKPVLVTRRVTERPEAVEAGAVRIIGENPERIIESVSELLADQGVYREMARAVSPYGDGFASRRVADILQQQLGDHGSG